MFVDITYFDVHKDAFQLTQICPKNALLTTLKLWERYFWMFSGTFHFRILQTLWFCKHDGNVTFECAFEYSESKNYVRWNVADIP